MNVGACDKYGSKTAQHKIRARKGWGWAHSRRKGKGKEANCFVSYKGKSKVCWRYSVCF